VAVTGGDVGMGALTGAIAGGIGWGVGWVNENYLDRALSNFTVATFSGSLGGGIGSVLQGGDFWEGARYGAIGAAIGTGIAGISGIVRTLSEKWRRPPVEISPKLPDSLATDLEEVAKLNTRNVWWKNGMHAWHAGSNAAIASRLGPLAAPFQWLAGLYHELPFDWESFKAEQEYQGTVNHFLDSFTDIVANTYGIVIGNLFGSNTSIPLATITGNYIPGPGETDRRFGGNGPYKGNPFAAWGAYP